MDLSHLSAVELRALRSDPRIGEYMLERIDWHLAVAESPTPSRRRRHAKARVELAQPVVFTVPWHALASDNTRGGVIGQARRDERRAYEAALATFRRHAGDAYTGPLVSAPVRVDVVLWYPDERVRDNWNFGKLLGDGLKGVILADDRWQVLRDGRIRAGGVDRANPRAEISVEAWSREEAA